MIGANSSSDTDDATWLAVDNAQQSFEREAKQGKRFAVWVTVVDQLKTIAGRSPLGPCDEVGSGYYGYGHLSVYLVQIVVLRFIDIEVKENPNSPYAYSHINRQAL